MLAEDAFLTEDEILMCWRHWAKISARSL